MRFFFLLIVLVAFVFSQAPTGAPTHPEAGHGHEGHHEGLEGHNGHKAHNESSSSEEDGHTHPSRLPHPAPTPSA